MRVKGRPKGDVERYMGLLLVNPAILARRLLDMGADTKCFLIGVAGGEVDAEELRSLLERAVMCKLGSVIYFLL
jgi:hypothetical protein